MFFSPSVMPQAVHVVWLHQLPYHTHLNMRGSRFQLYQPLIKHTILPNISRTCVIKEPLTTEGGMKKDEKLMSLLLHHALTLSFLSSINGEDGKMGTFCVIPKAKVASK